MNAIELLKKDHETVKELLSRLEETTERAVQTRKKLISKIEQELKIHTALEEQAQQGCVLAYKFKGQRFDCGSAEGYVQATNFCFENRHKTNPVIASPRLQAV